MTTAEHPPAEHMWAHRTFELLEPAVQRDIDATRRAVQDYGIRDGWDGVRLLNAVGYAVGQSQALINAELKAEKRREWSDDDRRDYYDELAELRRQRHESIVDGRDAWY